MLLSLFVACNPQDAVLSDATYTTWIAANSSAIIADEMLPFITMDASDSERPEGAPDVLKIECSERGWNTNKRSWDEGYIGPKEGEGNPENVIGGSCSPDDAVCLESIEEELESECAAIDNLQYHTFLQNDAFYVFSDTTEPWRSEAILNGEGDFQLTVHTPLPHDEDFRFAFTINSDFQPTRCVSDLDGNPKVEFVDGSDWLTQWSKDEGEYVIYYLNSGSYQANPNDPDELWFLVTDWLSGFGHAKFAGEEFNSIPVSYGNYDNDPNDDFMLVEDRYDVDLLQYDQEVCTLAGRAGVDLVGCSSTGGADVNEGGDEEESEEGSEEGTEENVSYSFQDEMDIVAVGGNVLEGRSSGFTHKVESNDWRPVNTSHFGLDGWAEVHSSWVRIKKGSEFVNGGRVEGDYQVFYTALESNSRLLVKGSFVVESLREDTFSYNFFEDQKRDQYDTEFCGGAKLGQ